MRSLVAKTALLRKRKDKPFLRKSSLRLIGAVQFDFAKYRFDAFR